MNAVQQNEHSIMSIKSTLFWRSLLLACAVSFCASSHADDAGFLQYLQENNSWETGASITATGGELELVPGSEKKVIATGADKVESLQTNVQYGDAILVLEYMPSGDADAGLFLQGRYEISLAGGQEDALGIESPGGLQRRWDGDAGKLVGGKAPLTNANVASGEWQRLEVKFRAPRYDEASRKVDNALILEARLNGELVQKNTVLEGFTQGSISPWETTQGPMVLTVDTGALAIRNFSAQPADFSALEVPEKTGGATNEAKLEDFVALGKKNFYALGCQECHAVDAGDKSMKTGPNLFGLFKKNSRDREIVEAGGNNRFTIQADASYLHRSVREPGAELAVVESGAKKGEAYMPIMPPYGPQILSDKNLDAIGFYLKTLNTIWEQGPVVKLVEAEGPVKYDPLKDDLQFLVDDRLRIQRGPMEGLSARAIHVGQPNAVNYSFDPRILGIAKLWQGGFLDMSGELMNRGGGGLKTGFQTREIDLGESGILFAPLNSDGEMIDFSFKEAVFNDMETIKESLWSEQDHLDRLAAEKARFLGYERQSSSKTAAPTFKYQVGGNRVEVATSISDEGRVAIEIGGKRAESQRFLINPAVLVDAEVDRGKIKDGVWTLPAGSKKAILSAEVKLASNAWKPEASDFDHEKQPLKVIAAEGQLPEGYSLESYLPPQDNYGRDQLFEALGLAVAEDGTIVVATRTAGIWRIKDGHWELFAEGLFDSLGVKIEDKHGSQLVVGQKPELTRITDTDGDGRADSFETLFDAHSFHGNYHTYMHGPARGAEADYYVTLNLAHTDKAVYKAGGKYMGTQGGLSGWAVRVTPEGEFELFANGLRSPAGLAKGIDDRLWYTDNQGEFVGTSKLFVLEEGKFYGHPSSLVDLPGMTPASPEIAWDKVADSREKAVVLFPHNQVANSPGHPVWDTTKGAFGPFAGQMFIGDQTQSNLLRVTTEVLSDGTEQGAVMPFAKGLASGVMRPVFLPDGSMLVGQTGRGWQAKGGHVASLQRLTWDGETRPFAIEQVRATDQGFEIRFTKPLPASVDLEVLAQALSINSWVYRDAPDYGSEVLDERAEPIADVNWSEDRQSLRVELESVALRQAHPQQTGRIYHLVLPKEQSSKAGASGALEAFYTLHKFPVTEE